MIRRTLLLLPTVMLYYHSISQNLGLNPEVNGSSKSKNKIVIEGNLTPGFYTQHLTNSDSNDSLTLLISPLDYVEPHTPFYSINSKISNEKVKWTIYSAEPLLIEPQFSVLGLVAPGDSIHITYNENEIVYSGKGANIFNLRNTLYKIEKNLKKPTRNKFTINSLEDYYRWNNYLDNKVELQLPILDQYKTKLSSSEYEFVKTLIISLAEQDRAHAFGALVNYNAQSKPSPISFVALSAIWDSTLYKPKSLWLRSLKNYRGSISSIYAFHRLEVWRKFDFDLTKDSLKSKEIRTYLYYKTAKENFKGLLRERLMAFILDEQTLTEMGPSNETTKKMLSDYYSQSQYPELKKWVQHLEEKANELRSSKGAPDFELTDKNGNTLTKQGLKGKIVLLDFWFTGCQPCAELTPNLHKLEKAFSGDTSIIFVSISTDKEKSKWLKSMAQKKYTTEHSIKLYTGGQGKDHPMLKQYNISGYPDLYLLNTTGAIVQYPLPDARTEKGLKELINLIRKEKKLLCDGPYIIHKKDEAIAYNIENTSVHTRRYPSRQIPALKVLTDEDKTFEVTLKPELTLEPSEFEKPDKLLILSDIEGNFNSLRKILQSNKIIDENYNWTFGKGHLVFAGDLFDRGPQVTECLWLIYALEEKAKNEGGYVHFILGNHEIMNLSGDVRYARQKYKKNAALIGETIAGLYNENTELGRWLRTKNIVEKIGDLLITHGGISPEVNNASLTIEDINKLSRPFYAGMNSALKQSDVEVKMLYNNYTSPFWYRFYYKPDHFSKTYNHFYYHATNGQVDSTLQKFRVNHIITGHTIVSDTITVHYEGKVINTDTPHTNEKGEALLVEGNSYYRVNINGERVLLIKQKER